MSELKIEVLKKEGEPPLLSYDDVLKILEDNRKRIRTLSSLILTVAGFLLSSWFIILFFIIESQNPNVSIAVFALVLAGIICLLVTILFSILSVMIPTPKAASDKLVLIDTFTAIYHRELWLVKAGSFFLLFSIVLFILGLLTFTFQVI